MSDYRDYEIRVAYDGGIYVSAIDEEEALKLAREIIGEEGAPHLILLAMEVIAPVGDKEMKDKTGMREGKRD